MNYKNLINEKIIYHYTNLLSDIMYIYYNNGVKIERQDILKELIGIRELKKDEIDNIYNKAFENFKEKYKKRDDFN